MMFELCKKVFKRYYLCFCSNSMFLEGGRVVIKCKWRPPRVIYCARAFKWRQFLLPRKKEFLFKSIILAYFESLNDMQKGENFI